MNQNEGYVNLGQVVCARGNKGEVALEEWTSGVERFESLEAVEILAKDGRDLGRFEIESAWLQRGRVILKFSGVDDIAEAEKLAGAGSEVAGGGTPGTGGWRVFPLGPGGMRGG